jgi:heterogeneous nuclear rnp K-like protein 2
MIPSSPQRVLSVSGVADAIHIAVYYIGTILQEHAAPVAASNTTYRPSGGNTSYNPGGGGGEYRGGGGGGGGGDRGGAQRQNFSSGAPGGGGGGAAVAGPGQQTQQIFIPNELVGESRFRVDESDEC